MPGGGAARERVRGEQVEGRHAVRELLRARRRKVHSLWVAEGHDPAPIVDEIVALAEAQRVPTRRVGSARLAAEARTTAPRTVSLFVGTSLQGRIDGCPWLFRRQQARSR